MASFALLAGTLAATPGAAQFTIGDIDFANWSVCAECGPFRSRDDILADGAFDLERQAMGGNDGAWLETTLTLPTVTDGDISYWVAYFNPTLTWEPDESLNGPIASLDFEVDGQMGEGPPSRIYTLGIRQDEYVWAAVDKRIFMQDEAWTATPISCLSEKDFQPLPFSRVAGQPERPDFSASGSTIEFGLVQGQSCPGSADCSQPITRVLGIDNFSVVVNGGFRINPGVADAWYEPATNGQGIYVAVFPDFDLLSLAWFTFDIERPVDPPAGDDLGEPAHRWLTAAGPYCRDTAELTVYRTTGGIFDMPPALTPGDTEAIGTAVLQWDDCDTASLKYELPDLGLDGDIPLQRVAPNAGLCEDWLGPKSSD